MGGSEEGEKLRISRCRHVLLKVSAAQSPFIPGSGRQRRCASYGAAAKLTRIIEKQHEKDDPSCHIAPEQYQKNLERLEKMMLERVPEIVRTDTPGYV